MEAGQGCQVTDRASATGPMPREWCAPSGLPVCLVDSLQPFGHAQFGADLQR
jgi:hypothetical protein